MASKSKSDNEYKSILKGNALFGGVQVFQMLISVVRLKFVAILLGPAGMGVASLFNTSAQTIQRFGSLGLNLTMMKEVSRLKEEGADLSEFMAVVRRLILFTALLGSLFCAVASPRLSAITFGDSSMTIPFLLLSIAVFFQIASAGWLSVLQGLREVSRIAKASLIASLIGLLGAVPLYWWLGREGIVPAMILMGFALWIYYLVNVSQSVGKLSKVGFSWNKHRSLVWSLVGMGVILMSGELINNALTYLLNLLIRKYGTLEDVGFYQATNSLTLQVTSVVFSAMAMDYLPRLTAVAADNDRLREVVNRQGEIVALLITPISLLIILFAPLALRILFNDQFMPALPLLRWMAFAVGLRALMFPLAYITFAKDNKRLYFWMEGVIMNLMTFLLSFAGFLIWGVTGLGVGASVDCSICLVIYYFVNRRLYAYRFNPKYIYGIIASVLTMGVCLLMSLTLTDLWQWISVGSITAAVSLFSLLTLRNLLKSR